MSSDIVAKKANDYNGYAIKYTNGQIKEYGSVIAGTNSIYNKQINFTYNYKNIPTVVATCRSSVAYRQNGGNAIVNSIVARCGHTNRIDNTSFYISLIQHDDNDGSGDIGWYSFGY